MKVVICVRIWDEKSGRLFVEHWVNVSPQSQLFADRLWISKQSRGYRHLVQLQNSPFHHPLGAHVAERLLEADTAYSAWAALPSEAETCPSLTLCQWHKGVPGGEPWWFYTYTSSILVFGHLVYVREAHSFAFLPLSLCFILKESHSMDPLLVMGLYCHTRVFSIPLGRNQAGGTEHCNLCAQPFPLCLA